mgnify:CR=1 FL=1
MTAAVSNNIPLKVFKRVAEVFVDATLSLFTQILPREEQRVSLEDLFLHINTQWSRKLKRRYRKNVKLTCSERPKFIHSIFHNKKEYHVLARTEITGNGFTTIPWCPFALTTTARQVIVNGVSSCFFTSGSKTRSVCELSSPLFLFSFYWDRRKDGNVLVPISTQLVTVYESEDFFPWYRADYDKFSFRVLSAWVDPHYEHVVIDNLDTTKSESRNWEIIVYDIPSFCAIAKSQVMAPLRRLM